MTIFQFLEGSKKIECKKEHADFVLDILTRENLYFRALRRAEDGSITFSLPNRDEGRLSELCRERAGAYRIISEKSLARALKRRRRRIGLLFGVVLCAITLYVSTLFVWNIKIISPDNVNEAEIIALLEESGFHIGSYIPACDFEKTALEVLMRTDAVSFLSINMTGTVAEVEVAARTVHPPAENEKRPSNLVAKYTGHILRYEVRAGQIACKIGEVVEKGHLLISGVYESKHHGDIAERAEGAVYAMIEEQLVTEYPLTPLEKKYTGAVEERRILSVFGKETPLYRDEKIGFDRYEETVEKQKLTLFSALQLPGYLTTYTYREFVLEELPLSDEEARERCEEAHSARLAAFCKDAEIVEHKTEAGVIGGKYVIRSTLTLIRDIAEEVFIDGEGVENTP